MTVHHPIREPNRQSMIPGEYSWRGDIEANRAGRRAGNGREHGGPADPGGLALPRSSRRQSARLRTRRAWGMRLDIPAGTAVALRAVTRRSCRSWTSRRARGCTDGIARRRPPDEAGRAGAIERARAEGYLGAGAWLSERLPGAGAMMRIPRRQVRGPIRTHRRRSRAARRHDLVIEGRARLHDLWRRGEVRRRQGDPRRMGHRPAPRRRRACSISSSPMR